MRLAVLSDIHGNLTAFEAALADLQSAGGADTVWVLGDLAAFGPRPAECVRRVQSLGEQFGKDNVHVIHGNTDRYIVTGTRAKSKPAEDAEGFAKLVEGWAQRDIALNWSRAQLGFDEYSYLSKLWPETGLRAPGYGYVIGYHGIPGDDEGYLFPNTPQEEALDALLDREGRMGIGGHIHEQMDRDLGTWRAINVGSVGLSFQNPGYAQWGLFTFDENGAVNVDLRNVPYDVESVVADLTAVNHPAPDWLLQIGKLRDHA